MTSRTSVRQASLTSQPTSVTSHLAVTLLTLLLKPVLITPLKSGPLTDLHIMGLFPMSGSWAGGQGCKPAAELGLEHVNNREDILPGYKINMTWSDTQCIPGYGVHVMYKMFNEPPPKMIVLGGGCSKVSQPTAESSHYWNVVQMSYGSVSPALSDKSRYPKFFRTSSSDVGMNPVRIAMMKQFNWKRVATISESLEIFTKVAENMAKLLPLNNITLITAEIFTDDPSVQIASLKKHDARIILLGAYEDKGLKVFCQAYKQGLYGTHLVWYVPGWWNDQWWARSDATQRATGCTTEEISLVARGTMHTVVVHLNPEQVDTAFGITSGQYLAMYRNYTNHKTLFAEHMAPQAFDGLMVIGLVLNMTMNQLREKGSKKRLEDYQYDDMEMNDMIYDNFWRIRFQGVKGLVYFDENGDHPAKMMIERVEDGEKTNKGIYDPILDRIDWNEDNPIRWEDGAPPADSTTVVYVPSLVPVAIYGAMCTLAGLGILLGVAFLGFNIRYRKRRVVKMSSPFINNIIVVGCMLVYSTVIVHELKTEDTEVMCQVRTFTLMIGFSTSFGALFAKTWRVHIIFTSKLQRVVMKDRKLVLIITGIVGFDIVLFTVFTILDPMEISKIDTDQTFVNHGNTLLQSQVSLCTSDKRIYFDAIVYASKGLMLIFGTFLAWETRKVTIPALNDSQYIGMCIYNVVVLSIMGVVLAYVLVLQVTLHYVLTSAILILGTTMTQAIIFVPKIVKVKEQGLQVEEGEGGGGDDTKSTFANQSTAQAHGDGDTATTTTVTGADTEKLERELKKARQEAELLKKQLKEKDEIIRRLKENN